MRIFVGYGYNNRDKWVEDYVFPLVVAFGCEVAHGKVAYGGALPEEIIKTIRSSDAMVGFTTRREPSSAGLFRTHQWVIDELLMAHGEKLPWVEVREDGVESPGAILESAGTRRIYYQEADRADCLVKIAQALSRFREQTSIITVRLGPAATVDHISALLQDSTFACTCETLRGTRESPPRSIKVRPITGSLFVQLRGIGPDEFVRITISARGRVWRSSYETVDTVDIQVNEE
jgi:hypothetical protein